LESIGSVLSRTQADAAVGSLNRDVAEPRCLESARGGIRIEGNEGVVNVQLTGQVGINGIDSEKSSTCAKHS
jgi:hypothetical protein